MTIRIAPSTALVLVLASLTTACFERTLRPLTPCTRANAVDRISVRGVENVDLLLMIDNSGSMSQEQAALTREIPELVRVLATGDRDEDGTPEFPPVSSLHIGVVTSDMGTGGYAIPTCDRGTYGNQFGDDGVLIRRGTGSIAGCSATYPGAFAFASGITDPAQYAFDVACVATAGTGGCGFEQQLEAVLKAVSPASPQEWTREGYVPPVFFGSTAGHADGANAGFIRPDSALALLLVTDEEDCSVADPELFDASSTTYPGDLNLRCWMHEERSNHPIQRYVAGEDGRSGLLALRDNPGLLIFAGIVGVPLETVPADGSTPDYEAMLAHESMQNVLDPDAPSTAPRLRPSCNVPGVGEAYPPRRIVRTAQALQAAGAGTTIQSICQSSYAGALDTVIGLLERALNGACLPRDLNPDGEGFVGCEVLEVLPADAEVGCADLPGRTAAGTRTIDGEEGVACAVTQVGPASSAPGWFYETAEQPSADSDIVGLCGPEGQRIRFTIEGVTGAEIRLECLQTVAPAGEGTVAIGSFCDPLADVCGAGTAPAGAGFALACDPADRTCGVRCSATTDCTAAGLLGEVCDTRSFADAVGANDQGVDPAERERRIEELRASGVADPEGTPRGFCVSATCL